MNESPHSSTRPFHPQSYICRCIAPIYGALTLVSTSRIVFLEKWALLIAVQRTPCSTTNLPIFPAFSRILSRQPPRMYEYVSHTPVVQRQYPNVSESVTPCPALSKANSRIGLEAGPYISRTQLQFDGLKLPTLQVRCAGTS